MNIYQHFRPEERDFIDQVLNWKNHVEKTYSPKLTDFLDPREQQIVSTIVGQHEDVKFSFFGGVNQTERKRALFFSGYDQPEDVDYQISLFQVNYPSKFVTIEHRHVLGSLMSLGLKRGKYGDILYRDSTVQFFCAKEVSEYIQLELTSIGKATIRLEEIPFHLAVVVEESWQEASFTSSSLRLDAIIASIFQCSRQKSQILIGQGYAKVNWAVIESSSFECKEGDTLSVRGYGRVKLGSIDGKTKKDKWRITAQKQK
jgi:RNA-binding protein YlmH